MSVEEGSGLSVEINGQRKEFAHLQGTITLDTLMNELGLKADRVAIEINGEIAARTTWPTLNVRDGDRLEIVHFVGGGFK